MQPLHDDEVLEIIRRLQSGGYTTEHETSEKAHRIVSRYPGVLDLIFHDPRELTPEQVLAEAKNRRPILLGP
ncbi:hypothetical protein F0U61_07970 [Archangium violaceum]|uniref:hypothetical protein n=1 Tax=Archangium violaceum TaxID=83451 RepID=UPI002B2D8860|nr:hypothetical protein F0U61_07970 [Archangium violaceum]